MIFEIVLFWVVKLLKPSRNGVVNYLITALTLEPCVYVRASAHWP